MEKQPQGGIRRVVTEHDSAGKAVVKFEDEQPLLDLTPEHATFSVSTVIIKPGALVTIIHTK